MTEVQSIVSIRSATAGQALTEVSGGTLYGSTYAFERLAVNWYTNSGSREWYTKCINVESRQGPIARYRYLPYREETRLPTHHRDVPPHYDDWCSYHEDYGSDHDIDIYCEWDD